MIRGSIRAPQRDLDRRERRGEIARRSLAQDAHSARGHGHGEIELPIPVEVREISFPGGRLDEGESSLVTAALREAEEEIGLPGQAVELVGALQPTPTIATSYAVYPFVGLMEPGREWTLSPREVAEILELSLPALRNGYGRRRLVRRGIPFRTDTYVIDDNLIWGATARILGDLLDRVPA